MKQNDIATTSSNVIPTVSTIAPSTLVVSLAPTTSPTTTLPVIAESTTKEDESGEKVVELVKAMEEMSIQAIEMNRMKEKVASLKISYKLEKIMQKEETQKANRMSERVKASEKELTLEKPLGQAKELLWATIVDSVKDIWPSIQVIFEQTKLIKIATIAIQKAKEELRDMQEDANRLIHFLNNKNIYEF